MFLKLEGLSLRASQTPPLLNDLPRHVLEPVSLDDVHPQFSTAPTVSMECRMGVRTPETIGTEQALVLVLGSPRPLYRYLKPQTFTFPAPP